MRLTNCDADATAPNTAGCSPIKDFVTLVKNYQHHRSIHRESEGNDQVTTQGRVKIAACTELVTLSGELWNNCGA
jgi:hypothetical protein